MKARIEGEIKDRSRRFAPGVFASACGCECERVMLFVCLFVFSKGDSR